MDWKSQMQELISKVCDLGQRAGDIAAPIEQTMNASELRKCAARELRRMQDDLLKLSSILVDGTIQESKGRQVVNRAAKRR